MERVILPNILPETGNYVGLIMNKSITSKVELTVEEIEKYGVTPTETGGLRWNPKDVPESFEVEFSEKELEVIKTSIQRWDKEEKLTKEYITIYEKFNQ